MRSLRRSVLGTGSWSSGSLASLMPFARPARPMRTLFALALITAVSAGATAGRDHSVQQVILTEPFEVISARDLTRLLARKIGNLGKIDPDRPLADDNGQTLSMFGREDLIAATSNDYMATRCAPLAPGTNILDEIGRRARLTSIVIINESHERSEHRGFTAQVARRLRPLGYDTLAMETLTNNPASTPKEYLPVFIQKPDLPYLTDGDGFYLSESAFGRLGRLAKALGYGLVPYENNEKTGLPPDAPVEQQIAVREEAQARNLSQFLKEHPGAKILIHVGYSHAGEEPHGKGDRWMALRLKEKTGVDPLTISQTTCRGGDRTDRFSALPADLAAGTFDLVIDHPDARFVRGRPAWRLGIGDRPVSIPRALWPTSGWRVIEARPEGEPSDSVPMDRVAIRPGEDIALMLPPGRYRLRIIDVTQAKQSEGKTAN